MKSQYKKIYKHTESKPLFGNWEIDVIVVFVMFFFLAINFTTGFIQFVAVISLGIVASSLLIKIKTNFIKGFLRHLLYMYGLKKPKKLPPSHIRIFYGN